MYATVAVDHLEWQLFRSLATSMYVRTCVYATVAVDYFVWQLFRGLVTSMYYTNISQWKFSWIYVTIYIYELKIRILFVKSFKIP